MRSLLADISWRTHIDKAAWANLDRGLVLAMMATISAVAASVWKT